MPASGPGCQTVCRDSLCCKINLFTVSIPFLSADKQLVDTDDRAIDLLWTENFNPGFGHSTFIDGLRKCISELCYIPNLKDLGKCDWS